MKRKCLLTGLIGLMLVPMAQAWEGKTLKVCADPNNPPYSGEKKQGFENRIAELFAKELDKKIEYTWFPQRMGFIRNTLKAQWPDSEEYKCDVVLGLPTGVEMVATTNPYYRSTYVLAYVKKRGFDDIQSADDLANLEESRKAKLKLAMFDGSPATTWLLKHNMLEYAKTYQSMGGDASVNTAQMLEKEMKEGKLDMAIIWGPIGAWLQYHNKLGPVELIPMHSEPGVKFEFPMSMGVRIPDKERKEELNQLIESKAKEIRKILADYHIPLVDENGKIISP
ncbi:MAG: quinoprotein dehydrogenase-associated putative ABC transporter substrate-binding protein [Methylococcaceae bacterium]|nr:quinoprotein dehydrogenase-associated putative ABC transporter substrate-binding protein [Methylococcaceae bacterium]